MKRIAVLQTVQVGTPRRYHADGPRQANGSTWETSFFREPSPERRWLFFTHLEGNAQADTKNHGTPDQAVLLYAAAHYPVWQEELGRSEIGPGGFGENFTIDGLTEATACIGDTYAIGGPGSRSPSRANRAGISPAAGGCPTSPRGSSGPGAPAGTCGC